MEFVHTLLPRFDDAWVVQCETIVSDNGGNPPHVTCAPYPPYKTYAYPSVVDDENQAAMGEYLKIRDSDMVSRFAVLRYLRAASLASVPSEGGWAHSADGGIWRVDDDEGDRATEAMRARSQKALTEFTDRLAPESIATAKQAMWEFKQAFLLFRWERLKRLGPRYASLAPLPADELNLLLGRALWLPNGQFCAHLILSLVTGEAEYLPWEAFIDGNPLEISRHASIARAQSHEAANSEDMVLDAIASLRKVRPEIMGAHWGILADCYAMTHEPGACAKIWEDYGVQIVAPVAISTGRSAADILSEPDLQLQIADLWAGAKNSRKEVEILESLRSRHPRLQGVNRRLADCYISAGDLKAATQHIQDEARCDEAFSEDPIVRLLLRECGNAEEADRRFKEAREKYENSPASGGQRSAIRNVLQLSWKPFVGLSPTVQEDWVSGLHWCCGEPPSFNETERAGYAIYRCCLALEVHLREKLFEPIQEAATATEIKQLPKAFGPLRSSLEKRSAVALTVMLDAVASAGPSVPGVIKRLWDLLNKRSSQPYELRSKKYLEIASIRNPNVHESRPMISRLTVEDARRCIELCTEFFSILETPPPPPGPGRQAGTFQRR
jgi:hypothetical protein